LSAGKLNCDAEQVGQQLVSLPYLQLKQLHSFLAGDHVVATGSDMIGSQWVQTPRHGDPIASTAGAIGGEGSFVAGI
jgi:hypothetical protein